MTSVVAAPTTEPVPVQSPAPPVEVAPEPAAEVVIERVETSDDEVILRDGSFARGKVIDLSKGSHVSITVDDETRKIPWAEIERVRLGTAPTPAAPAASETPADPAPAVEASTQQEPPVGAQVYIESTNGRDVTLYRVSGGFAGASSSGPVSGIAYEPVCSRKCGVSVDGSRGHEFFVGGDGITPSRKFTLEDSGPVTLEVKAGHKAARFGGVILVSGGASFLVTGLLFVGISSLRRMGAGFAIGGGVSLAVGIPVLLIGRTVVKQRRGRPG